MRYIVAVLKTEQTPEGISTFEKTELQSLIPCDDKIAVSMAIGVVAALQDPQQSNWEYDWNVFELETVNGTFFKKVSVIFNPDGRTVREIV